MALNQTVSVAFQGELGAYSQKAVYSFFGRDQVKQVLPLPTLQRVFEVLCQKEDAPDFAVVPIENSTAGSVGETVDLLISKNVRIVGETSVPVEHCLIIHKDTDLGKIRKVMSHPQALAQCREYLDQNGRGWEQISVYDTAGSVKMIREQNLKDTAGIASELAAEIYGMKVAAKGIEDDHSNTTRFIVIENAQKNPKISNEPTGQDKTSAIFATKHEPGCLVRALSALSSRGINLDRIESRPIRGKPWEYYFYVDFSGHVREDACRKAIEDLRYQCEEVKVLGSYRRGL
ncbi:MAG: prephenate dehydratase [Nitrososphaerota archaeon]|nr:prephenate dehydratase [Nitrososphaerota archaeon]